LSMPNVLCTPHLGWAEWTNFELYFREAFEQIAAYQQGLPMRLANPEVQPKLSIRPSPPRDGIESRTTKVIVIGCQRRANGSMNALPSRPALHPPASSSPRPLRIATQPACSSGGYMSLTIGRPLTAVLICAGAVLMMSGAANAKASKAK